MSIDRRAFIASVGGSAAFAMLAPSGKADALEAYLQGRLNEAVATPPAEGAGKYPTVAELEAQIESAPVRRGVGNLFAGDVLLLVIGYLLPFFGPIPFYFLELFVGFIQAFVFAFLTLIFMTLGTTSHGHEDPEEAHVAEVAHAKREHAEAVLSHEKSAS